MSSKIPYTVVAHKNPLKRNEAPKYYAQARYSGDKTIEEQAAEIEASCTVTSQDVLAVMEALRKRCISGLQEGKIMRLGNIGYLRITLSSKGTEKKADFNAGQIDHARIIFTPGITLKKMLGDLHYENVSGSKTGSDSAGSDSGAETGEDVQA